MRNGTVPKARHRRFRATARSNRGRPEGSPVNPACRPRPRRLTGSAPPARPCVARECFALGRRDPASLNSQTVGQRVRDHSISNKCGAEKEGKSRDQPGPPSRREGQNRHGCYRDYRKRYPGRCRIERRAVFPPRRCGLRAIHGGARVEARLMLESCSQQSNNGDQNHRDDDDCDRGQPPGLNVCHHAP
jgi:hypothetical protein